MRCYEAASILDESPRMLGKENRDISEPGDTRTCDMSWQLTALERPPVLRFDPGLLGDTNNGESLPLAERSKACAEKHQAFSVLVELLIEGSHLRGALPPWTGHAREGVTFSIPRPAHGSNSSCSGMA